MVQKIKRGTPEQWTQSEYILEYGQLGVSWNKSPDSQPILKVGNGVDKFDDLPELSASSTGGGGSTNIRVGTTLPDNTEGQDGDLFFLISQ